MALIRTAGALLAAGLLLLPGCAKRGNDAPRARQPSSIAEAQRMRETLVRTDPTARVGIVAAALPDERLVAVTDVQADAFQKGDSVQFIDARGQVVGEGSVERVVNNVVHIRYAAGGGRAPTVADLAVRTGGGMSGPPGGSVTVGTDAGAPDPGGAPEAVTPDAGTPDATTDAGTDDAAPAPPPGPRGASRLPPRRPTNQPPAGVETPAPDASTPDAAAPDAPAPDAPAPDAPAPDQTAAPDTPAPDAGATGDAPEPADQDPPPAQRQPDLNK